MKRTVLPSPRYWYSLSLITWLVVAVVVCLVWGAAIANQSRAVFEQDSRILHRVLSQRAEQHEAVLASLVALERSGVGVGTLSDFARAMRLHYPQIELVERCVSARATQLECLVLNGSLTGAPSLKRLAFQAALAQRHLAVTHAQHDPIHPRFVLSQAMAGSALMLWIDARRFVGADEFPHPDAHLELRSDTGGAVLFQQLPEPSSPGIEAALLPRFELHKTLGSGTQPFTLRVARQFGFSELPFVWMVLFALFGAVLSLLLARVLLTSREARFEQRRAELALGRERARAEGTVRAVSEALVTCDRDGIITLVNPAAQTLLGKDAVPLLGQPLSAVVRFQGTLSGQPLGTFLESFWLNPQAMALPEGATLLDGQHQARLVEGSLCPLFDETGQLAGAVLACHDLGPFRKRLLEALERSERRVREHESTLAHVGRVSTLSEIAAGIAHELNQPLTAILSHAQASLRLLEDDSNRAQVRRSLQASAEQARRASQILERLRAHAARQPLQFECIDLRQLVENVRVLTEHELHQRGIRLEAQFESVVLEVVGDAIQLEQVLHNLLRNAVEVTASESTDRRVIQIVVQRKATSIRLEVRDFGPGIAPEVLPRLFTPFVSSKPGGLGLGLSLSQTLLQSMGGTLVAENADGGGARFALTMPAFDEVAGVR